MPEHLGQHVGGQRGVEGSGLRTQGIDPALFTFGIHGMAATATPGVQAYVSGLNPAASTT